jgi:hypothetical protein
MVFFIWLTILKKSLLQFLHFTSCFVILLLLEHFIEQNLAFRNLSPFKLICIAFLVALNGLPQNSHCKSSNSLVLALSKFSFENNCIT